MYGTNQVAHVKPAGDPLRIVEMFYTIQGEGPDAGVPAVFIRVAGCNLRCYFCDTDFETGAHVKVNSKIISTIKRLRGKADLVVITGGEPLLYDLWALIDQINDNLKMRVAVETAGTVGVHADSLNLVMHKENPYRNYIVCSPKTPKINPKIETLVRAWKYIIRTGCIDLIDGLPMMSTQNRGEICRIYRPSLFSNVPIYVQPMDVGDAADNMANLKLASEIAMKHGYRLSVQMHKLCDLP